MAARRIIVTVVLPLVVAAAGLANLILFRLDNLLRPAWPDSVLAILYAAAVAVVVLAAVAAVVLWSRMRGRRMVAAVALVLAVAVSFAPWIADFVAGSQQVAEQQAAGADAEMQFQGAYLDRSDDVEDRIAAKKPYTPAEALDLLGFAADADFSWQSLPDHTPEAFALVEQAIEGKILDPNALTTTTPTADSPAETITVAFYDRRIRPVSPVAIKKHDWDVLQILVAHGADLSGEGGAAIRADLARTVSGTGRYIQLK